MHVARPTGINRNSVLAVSRSRRNFIVLNLNIFTRRRYDVSFELIREDYLPGGLPATRLSALRPVVSADHWYWMGTLGVEAPECMLSPKA
jgi:hypothetical protein